MSRTLPWQPEGWADRLVDAMRTGDHSLQSLRDRQASIASLWTALNDRLCDMSDFHHGLYFAQKDSFQTLQKLIGKGDFTLEEWTAVQPLASLNYEPMHTIFKRVEDKVVFAEDALLSLQPEDMYVWMYQIASALRKEL